MIFFCLPAPFAKSIEGLLAYGITILFLQARLSDAKTRLQLVEGYQVNFQIILIYDRNCPTSIGWEDTRSATLSWNIPISHFSFEIIILRLDWKFLKS